MEQRAIGLFLKVQGPAGVVVSMAAWMLDPVACAGMTIGAPQVDRAALVELDQLLIDKGRNRRSPIDVAIVQEECHEDGKRQYADAHGRTVSNLTSTPWKCRREDDYAGRAGSRRRDSRIGVHEVQILSHGVDLVIEFAGEGNNFRDERIAPDREFRQVDFLLRIFGR